MNTMTNTRKTIGKDLPNGDYVEITAEERDGSSGLSAGFAITIDGWEKRGNRSARGRKADGRDIDYGGADHDTILRVAPELAPIVTAHLAGPDGMPMHAEANGWYFYSGKAAQYERDQVAAGKDYGYSSLLEKSDRERAAQALSIPTEDLPESMTQVEFSAFVESLAARWAAQAQAARDALAAMVDGEGVEDI